MYIFFLIFFLLVFFSLIKNEKIELVLFVASGILLFFLAAFRKSGIDRDYYGYIEYFNDVLTRSFSIIEPSFILITNVINRLNGNYLHLFIIYALLGVFLKLYAINKLTHFRLLSVLIYFSSFFLLFEMTQIRAGVAAGLLLLCIIPIKERKLIQFLFLASLAFFFHYSAIVIFPLYFLNGNSLNRNIYIILIPISYLIYFLKFDVFFFTNYIPISLIQSKIESYKHYASLNNTINVFNFVHMSRCLLAYLFLWKWKFLAEANVYSVILIKIYIIALFIYVTFAQVPAISSRINELLIVVEIILMPLLTVVFKPIYISILFVFGIGLLFLSFTLFYTKLLNF